MAVKDILLGLSNANGPSGAEGSAARLAMELLSDFTPVVRDSLGNVIAELGDWYQVVDPYTGITGFVKSTFALR